MIRLKPIITEKSLRALKNNNVYTFKGSVRYTKKQVKEFLEKVYNSKVVYIRVIKIPGRVRYNLLKRVRYQKPGYKKFLVKFADKVKVEGFNISSK